MQRRPKSHSPVGVIDERQETHIRVRSGEFWRRAGAGLGIRDWDRLVPLRFAMGFNEFASVSRSFRRASN